jgi:hypothetical protein
MDKEDRIDKLEEICRIYLKRHESSREIGFAQTDGIHPQR